MDFLNDSIMRVDPFDYHLPEELIAQRPLEDRAGSRLLHLDPISGDVLHRMFRDLPSLFLPGDVLVANETQVSSVRVWGNKPTGAQVEVLLLHRISDRTYEAMIRPSKRLKTGDTVQLQVGTLQALDGAGELTRTVRFDTHEAEQHAMTNGEAPLPPYIHERLADRDRYQTVYAKNPGSAAAPTAGLHFTKEIIQELETRGVIFAKVNLSVSLDTFRPLTVEDTDDHKMHGEACSISPESAEIINRAEGRVIAIGTTAARTLESFAIEKGKVGHGEMRTSIFIYPGYKWKIVRGLITNFHMPRTTMMLMLASICGEENLMRAYAQAVAERYRFLSFGDSMAILSNPANADKPQAKSLGSNGRLSIIFSRNYGRNDKRI